MTEIELLIVIGITVNFIMNGIGILLHMESKEKAWKAECNAKED